MIDLRSDTVTRPTLAMRAAMMAAPLGDDVLGDEPTVQALEAKVALLLGKDAALYVPSGTMANQLAIRSVCEHGDEIVAHKDSHIIHYETGAPATIPTNMVFFAVDPSLGNAQEFCARLAQHGVAAIGMGPSRVRMVTHLDVTSDDIIRAGTAIKLAAQH